MPAWQQCPEMFQQHRSWAENRLCRAVLFSLPGFAIRGQAQPKREPVLPAARLLLLGSGKGKQDRSLPVPQEAGKTSPSLQRFPSLFPGERILLCKITSSKRRGGCCRASAAPNLIQEWFPGTFTSPGRNPIDT